MEKRHRRGPAVLPHMLVPCLSTESVGNFVCVRSAVPSSLFIFLNTFKYVPAHETITLINASIILKKEEYEPYSTGNVLL